MSGVEEISDEQYLIQRAKHQLVERLPAPVEMTEAERYRWIAEFCDEMKYFKPTPVSVGHYLVIDCEGRRTVENNFGDAVELAAAKLKEGYHPMRVKSQ